MAVFSGRPGEFQQLSNFSPQIQSALNQNIMGLLGQVGNKDYLQDMMGQARQRFDQQTIPSIAERFTSMGEGAQSSGAFRGALGQAGVDLEKQLGGLGLQGQQMQQGLLTSLLGLGGMQNVYRPREQSGLERLLPGLFGAAGNALSPIAGGGILSLLSMFGGQ
jgi:hypothetical protein